MLLLSRKIGEEIVIDRKVHVRITRVSRNRAFLGHRGADTVSVDRREIWLAKERELAVGNRTSVRPAGPEAARQTARGSAGRGGPTGRLAILLSGGQFPC